MMHPFDFTLIRKINNVENWISNASFYPLILPGCAKIIMGVFQATLLPLIYTLRHFASDDKYSSILATVHFKHGISNMICGMVEALPISGTFLYYARDKHREDEEQRDSLVHSHHENKFFPYYHLMIDDATSKGDPAQTTIRQQMNKQRVGGSDNGQITFQEMRIWVTKKNKDREANRQKTTSCTSTHS